MTSVPLDITNIECLSFIQSEIINWLSQIPSQLELLSKFVLQSLSTKKPQWINRITEQNVLWIIEQLEKNSVLNKIDKVYSLNDKMTVESKNIGRVFLHQRGFGFIDKKDLFIHPKNLNSALDKDVVEYQQLPKNNAKVIRIVERYKRTFVGKVISKGFQHYWTVCDNPKILSRVKVFSLDELKVGDKILFKITNFHNMEGKILKHIGVEGQEKVDILSIIYDSGIYPNFPEEVIKEVKTLKEIKDKARQNLSKIPFVTIDPADAKDFDDAIYVRKTGVGFAVYVSISDVWTYIKKYPEVDKEAQKRGFSTYFLNSVLPMIPTELSNGLLSLQEQKERLCMTFQINVSLQGVIDWENFLIYPSLIKSHRRFTYEQVNDFFVDNKSIQMDEAVAQSLNDSLELSNLLGQHKRAVDFDIPTTKFIMKGYDIDDFASYQSGKAQKMVENLMVLANEGVAKYFIKHKSESIYRAHKGIDNSKINYFLQDCEELNIEIDQEDVLKSVKAYPENDLLKILFLKTMTKAFYTTEPQEHFGLSIQNYTHFTSPIRRYADLMVHKKLWIIIAGEQSKTEQKEFDLSLPSLAERLTTREVRVGALERDIHKMKIKQYLIRNRGKTYSGIIYNKNNYGITVKLGIGAEVFMREGFDSKLGEKVLVRMKKAPSDEMTLINANTQ